MVVTRFINGLTLAAAFVTDGALTLIVMFAVTAWVLVLSHSHRFLAKGLLFFLIVLGSLRVRSIKIGANLTLKVLVDPRVFILIIKHKWAEVRLRSDRGFLNIKAQCTF